MSPIVTNIPAAEERGIPVGAKAFFVKKDNTYVYNNDAGYILCEGIVVKETPLGYRIRFNASYTGMVLHRTHVIRANKQHVIDYQVQVYTKALEAANFIADEYRRGLAELAMIKGDTQ